MTLLPRRGRALLGSALAAALTGTLLGGLPVLAAPALAAGEATCTPDPVLCPARLYVGVSSPGLPADASALAAWGTAAQHPPSVALSFQDLNDVVSTSALKALSAAGRLPMLTIEPYDAASPTANPYPLSAIASGRFDRLLHQDAAAIKAVGAPVAVRFAHEMNGDWYPWGQGVNGNTPQSFLSAWRHVHDVFTADGATNVIWTWAPNVVDFAPTQDLGLLYPGDTYVDWVGLSGYFDEESDTYANLYRPTLAQLDRIAPSRPIYIVETSVLPGPSRPAMIHDLLTGLLGTQRMVGFTWFDHDKRSVDRFDWRLENDTAASAQMAGELDNGWFSTGSSADPPVGPPPAPVVQEPPALVGAPTVGVTLSASYGTWRTTSDGGTVSYAGRWYRCADPTSTASCVPTTGTSRYFGPSQWDLLKYLRYQVTATNAGGSTAAWSAPTRAIVMRPAQPAAPAVEARDRALRVTFPTAVPTGTTHWRLVVGGVPKPLVKVGSQADYWLTGLVSGSSYPVSLFAVSSSGTDELVSPANAGNSVPMTTPYTPYVKVGDTVATVTLPRTVPAGAQAWTIAVDNGPPITIALGTLTYDIAGASLGMAHTYALRAVAGSWPGLSSGSVTPPATGAFTLLAAPPGTVTPAKPTPAVVESRDGALKVSFPPAAPLGTTHWRLTVNGVTKPLYPVGSPPVWFTGLVNGTAYPVSLEAVDTSTGSTAASPAVTASVVPMTAPHTPYIKVSSSAGSFQLPVVPAGASSWLLTVDGIDRPLLSTAVHTYDVAASPASTHSWSLRAVAGVADGQPYGCATPAASGSFTLPAN